MKMIINRVEIFMYCYVVQNKPCRYLGQNTKLNQDLLHDFSVNLRES